MHGALTFFEIGVPDSVRAQTFYGRLFRWEFPPTGNDGDQVWIKTPTLKAGLHDQDAEAWGEPGSEVRTSTVDRYVPGCRPRAS